MGTTANEYENNLNELLPITTKGQEGVASDGSNIQEEMKPSNHEDLADFKLDDALAEIDNIPIGDDYDDDLMDSYVKFTEAMFNNDVVGRHRHQNENKNDDVTMTSLTNSMNSASISTKRDSITSSLNSASICTRRDSMTSLTNSLNSGSSTKKKDSLNQVKQTQSQSPDASYDDGDDSKPSADASPRAVSSSPVHQTKTIEAQAQAQEDSEEYAQQRRDSAKEKELISFQSSLNGKLEELVQSMKRTEESRHMLARHACRRNSMGSPGLTALFNQQQQQSFHQSFTAQPQPPQYHQYNLQQQQYACNDPNLQQKQTYPEYDPSYSAACSRNYAYGQNQHQYAYNHPPQVQHNKLNNKSKSR